MVGSSGETNRRAGRKTELRRYGSVLEHMLALVATEEKPRIYGNSRKAAGRDC